MLTNYELKLRARTALKDNWPIALMVALIAALLVAVNANVALVLLAAMGADVTRGADSVSVRPGALHGVDVDMGHCPDLVPTVAVLAAFAQGPTRVRNVAHLRIKESDRITAPATELARLGVRVDEHDDGLTVHGTGPDGPAWDEAARFSAHNDHRIAMSLALLGLPHGKRMDALLDDPLVVRKSFPTFWKVWERLL